MKKTTEFVFILLLFSISMKAQTSGNTPPPPPVCASTNAGAIYTDTGTSPPTVYTCSYFNLAWQWKVNPIYGGLVFYPTVPATCSGALPAFLAGWPDTQMYVCKSGFPEPVAGSGTFTALTGDAISTATGGATMVKGLNGVPFCTGFMPTAGQAVIYTTTSSPNPCWNASPTSGGITSVEGTNPVQTIQTGSTVNVSVPTAVVTNPTVSQVIEQPTGTQFGVVATGTVDGTETGFFGLPWYFYQPTQFTEPNESDGAQKIQAPVVVNSTITGRGDISTTNAVQDLNGVFSIGGLALGNIPVTTSQTISFVSGTGGGFNYLANATSGAITLTLPDATLPVATIGGTFTSFPTPSNPTAPVTQAAASTYPIGQIYVFKKVDSSANAVTITAAAGQTIDGAAAVNLTTQNQYIIIQSNGSGSAIATGWSVIGSTPNPGTITAVTGTAPVNCTTTGSSVNCLMAQATSSVDGYLSQIDWAAFNGKQNALTNPVTGPGSGATVGHLAVMGNTSGTSITDGGAVGTAAYEDVSFFGDPLGAVALLGQSNIIDSTSYPVWPGMTTLPDGNLYAVHMESSLAFGHGGDPPFTYWTNLGTASGSSVSWGANVAFTQMPAGYQSAYMSLTTVVGGALNGKLLMVGELWDISTNARQPAYWIGTIGGGDVVTWSASTTLPVTVGGFPTCQAPSPAVQTGLNSFLVPVTCSQSYASGIAVAGFITTFNSFGSISSFTQVGATGTSLDSYSEDAALVYPNGDQMLMIRHEPITGSGVQHSYSWSIKLNGAGSFTVPVDVITSSTWIGRPSLVVGSDGVTTVMVARCSILGTSYAPRTDTTCGYESMNEGATWTPSADITLGGGADNYDALSLLQNGSVGMVQAYNQYGDLGFSVITPQGVNMPSGINLRNTAVSFGPLTSPSYNGVVYPSSYSQYALLTAPTTTSVSSLVPSVWTTGQQLLAGYLPLGSPIAPTIINANTLSVSYAATAGSTTYALNVQCYASDTCPTDSIWQAPVTAVSNPVLTATLNAGDTTMQIATLAGVPLTGHVVTAAREEIGYTFDHTSGGNSIYNITRGHHGTTATTVSVGTPELDIVTSESANCSTCAVNWESTGGSTSFGQQVNPGLGPNVLGDYGLFRIASLSQYGGLNGQFYDVGNGGAIQASGYSAGSFATAAQGTKADNVGAVTGAVKSNGSATFGQAACGDLSDGASGCSTTVGNWAGLNYPTWTTGTPFVKMTAAGTFALDTNTYMPTTGGTFTGGISAPSVTASGLTSGNCVQVTTGGLLTTASGPCSTSSGTLTATGSPASGQIAQFSGPTSLTTATSANIQSAIGAGVYDAAGAAAARQANLSLVAGTYTDGGACTYTSSGTLLNCNSTYLTGNQSITLGGILAGSGTTSITASAASGYYMPSTSDESAWNGKQAAYTNLTSIGSLSNAAGWLHNDGSGNFAYSTPSGYAVLAGLNAFTLSASQGESIVQSSGGTVSPLIVSNHSGGDYTAEFNNSLYGGAILFTYGDPSTHTGAFAIGDDSDLIGGSAHNAAILSYNGFGVYVDGSLSPSLTVSKTDGHTAMAAGSTVNSTNICLADGTGGCVTLGGALSNSNFTTGAGGGGTSIPSFSVTGNDASFEVGITTGTTPSASTSIFSITYTAPRASSYCSVSPANANASAAQVWFVSIDQNSMHLASGLVPLLAATSYVWSFVCP